MEGGAWVGGCVPVVRAPAETPQRQAGGPGPRGPDGPQRRRSPGEGAEPAVPTGSLPRLLVPPSPPLPPYKRGGRLPPRPPGTLPACLPTRPPAAAGRPALPASLRRGAAWPGLACCGGGGGGDDDDT